MGTNYYFVEKCECCGNETRLHMGKSSAGWVYVMRVWPEKGITDLHSWLAYMEDRLDGLIYDEYGKVLSPYDWASTVLCRWRYGSGGREEDASRNEMGVLVSKGAREDGLVRAVEYVVSEREFS